MANGRRHDEMRMRVSTSGDKDMNAGVSECLRACGYGSDECD